ncbi:MAG: hypothetical protein IKV22_05280 [Paludibacteraceae bacterium]|nr:hypothetical protein [Paludibacteraceae bacterium]
MKLFIKKIFLLGLLCSGILFCLLLIMATYPDELAIESHESNVKYSSERLTKLDTAKIVIIGGSGCGFGLNSELLYEKYHIPVVNTGTQASIGLVMQLKIFEHTFTKNDIVIIIPEYHQFFKNTALGIQDESMYRILYNNYPSALRHVSLIQTIKILKHIPQYFKNAYSHKGINIDKNSPYSKHSLNQYGDVTNWEYRKHQNNIVADTIESISPNDKIIAFVEGFISQQEENGVRCLLLPPAYMEQSYNNSKAFIDTLDICLSNQGVPFMVPTERYKFVDTLFYDTHYHLTYEGAMLRTKMLIEDIDSCLNVAL